MAPKILYIWLLYLILFCITLSKAHMVPAIYYFGDSTLDVGNNNYINISDFKAQFSPNGVDYWNHEPTGRFSNGQNCADFLAKKVALPRSQPYLHLMDKGICCPKTGVSFASGGARILKCPDDSIPLSQQVEFYKEKVLQLESAEHVKTHLSKSFFIVAIGTNDIFDYFEPGHKRKPKDYINTMLINLEKIMKEMYDSGARKYVVIGSGPLGCFPILSEDNDDTEFNENVNQIALDFNEDLKSMLLKIQSEQNDFLFSFLDQYKVVSDFINSGTH